MMRSLSENCFAPNTSTSFILSVAWRKKSEFVPFPFQSSMLFSVSVVRQLNEEQVSQPVQFAVERNNDE